jgi:hypothetical protein
MLLLFNIKKLIHGFLEIKHLDDMVLIVLLESLTPFGQDNVKTLKSVMLYKCVTLIVSNCFNKTVVYALYETNLNFWLDLDLLYQ